MTEHQRAAGPDLPAPVLHPRPASFPVPLGTIRDDGRQLFTAERLTQFLTGRAALECPLPWIFPVTGAGRTPEELT